MKIIELGNGYFKRNKDQVYKLSNPTEIKEERDVLEYREIFKIQKDAIKSIGERQERMFIERNEKLKRAGIIELW